MSTKSFVHIPKVLFTKLSSVLKKQMVGQVTLTSVK